MAVPAQFLVLCACVLGFYHVEATPDTLSSLDSSFCHGGLEAIYPELDIDECLVIPKDLKLREKLSTVWKAPQIFFSGAHKRLKQMKNYKDKPLTHSRPSWCHQLAELGSIAQAALREQRLDISLILIPSRVHSKSP